MRLWKRGLLFLLTILMVASVLGCSQNEVLDKVDEETATVADQEESKKEPIVIVDHLGREVTIEEVPERIVSGYFISTSALIALGLEDKVVGIEAKADIRNIYHLAAPEFLELPNVGTAKEFDLEGCIALQPDLVILPVRLKEVVENLESLGINVIAVNPEDMDLLKETLVNIGLATGTKERADRLIGYYDEKVNEILDRAKDKESPRVYLGGNSDFLSTAPKKMYQHFMIETAGGINVAGDIEDTYWATISYEQLIAYNPDIIIIAPGATYTKEDIINDEKLSSINAIVNNEVYVMPDTVEAWDSPVPSSILGTMWLSSILYEEDYPYDEFKEDVVDFYREYYNIEINKDDITR